MAKDTDRKDETKDVKKSGGPGIKERTTSDDKPKTGTGQKIMPGSGGPGIKK
jgi:hypothetical protein